MQRMMIFFALASLPLLLTGQIRFEKHFSTAGGTDDSWGNWVVQTADAGHVLSTQTGTGTVLVRANAFGDTLATGQLDASVSRFVTIPGGGYMAVGTSGMRLEMLRLNEQFGLTWSRTCDTDPTFGQALCATADSGFCFLATAGFYPSEVKKLYIECTNTAGARKWKRSISDPQAHLYGRSIASLTDGGIVVCGSRSSMGGDTTAGFLLKLNGSGDSLWMRYFGGPSNIAAFEVFPTGLGDLLIAALQGEIGEPGNILLIRTDQDGNTRWLKQHDSIYNTNLLCAAPCSDGGAILAAVKSPVSVTENLVLLRVSESGERVWRRETGLRKVMQPFCIAMTQDGGFISCGASAAEGEISMVYLMKTDSTGHVAPVFTEELQPVAAAEPFPNPFSTTFTLRANEPVISVSVCSIFGVPVATQCAPAGEGDAVRITPDDAPEGIYLVTVLTTHSVITKRIIKRNR